MTTRRIRTKRIVTGGQRISRLSVAGQALAPPPATQGILEDQLFYFFLRLRKGEVRRVVQRVRSLYPGESPE